MLRQSIASATRRVAAASGPSATSTVCKRTFTSFTPLRPTLSARPPAFVRPTLSSFTPTSALPAQTAECGAIADLVPRTAITSHPALAQIRCGPRNTMNRNTRLIQKRRLGFVSRMRTKDGRKIIKRRMVKRRQRLGQ